MFLSCWWRIWVCLTMGWIFAVFHGFGGTIFSVRPIFLIFLVETLRASLFSFLIKSRHCASSPWRLSWRFNPQSWFHPHPPVIKHGSKIMKPWWVFPFKPPFVDVFLIKTSNLSMIFPFPESQRNSFWSYRYQKVEPQYVTKSRRFGIPRAVLVDWSGVILPGCLGIMN